MEAKGEAALLLGERPELMRACFLSTVAPWIDREIDR
jgi:hypothetical protein